METTPKKMRRESGFTLIEILISLMMVIAAFGMLSHFGTVNEQRVKQAPIEACNQTANNILSNIRSIGYVAANGELNRTNQRVTYPSSEVNKLNLITAVSANDIIPRGANGIEYLASDNYRRNFYGIAGTMTFLSNLYNDNRAEYCQNALGGVYQGFRTVPDIKGQFQQVQPRIRIQRQALFDASAAPDCANFIPAPSGEKKDLPTEGFGANTPPGVRYDSGYWVTVRVDYLNENGIASNCTASNLFQYPTIPKNPTMGYATGFNFTYSAPQGQCNTPRPGGVLTIDLLGTGDPLREGWVAMCRDASSVGSWSVNPSVCNGMDSENFSTNSNTWVKCEQVTACGVAPSSAQWTSDRRLQLSYANLPYGCRVAVATYVFDVAGNATDISGAVATSNLPTPNSCLATCDTALYNAGTYCAQPNNMATVCTPLVVVPVDGGATSDGGSDGGSPDGGDNGDGGVDGHDN